LPAHGRGPTLSAVSAVIASIWAAFVWPPLGLGMGVFAALSSGERSVLTIGSYMVAGLLGASTGGVVTYLFTFERAISGGFWTSIVTSMVGGLVFIGLFKAWLDARPSPPSPDS
jgi:uncharacterized membrane protein YeaQ/YmgE (transglycosylase-associated protein family)